MKRSNLGVLIGTALFFIMVIQAEATPIISVDMDPLLGGIQSTLTVDSGDTFTVDVVIEDDGLPPAPIVFDAITLGISFNDSGPIMGLGPTGPIAGMLATTTAIAFDPFGGSIVTNGSSLTPGPYIPLPGFANGSGAISILGSPFFIVAPSLPTSIFSIDFLALDLGTSDILASGTPPGSPELSFGGSTIFATLEAGTVNVVPEPTTILLLAIGMLGMGVFGRKKFKK